MRAVVYERYGPPDRLELREVETPTLRDNSVLIRVHAASVNRSDWETLIGRPAYVRIGGAGFLKPKVGILGTDVAGRVEAVGKDVTLFQPGDAVFGDIMWHGGRTFAEYVRVPEGAPIVLKPEGVSFGEAAALPQAGTLALQGLAAKGEVKPGQHVMINGAGGGSGTFAVQMAKSRGAEVTGVDSTPKLDGMRSVGADHVIDYRRDNFTKSGNRYDRILDFAAHRSIFAYRRALRPDGIYSMVGGSAPRMLQAFVVGSLISKTGNRKMGVLMARPNKEDMARLASLVAAGELTPVIDRRFELSEVPEALGYLGEGRAVGKLVITVTTE